MGRRRVIIVVAGLCVVLLAGLIGVENGISRRAAAATALTAAATPSASVVLAPPVPTVPAVPPVTAKPSTAPPTTAPPRRSGLAAAAVAAAETAAGDRTQLAVAVLDRTTGEVAQGGRGAQPYYTASLSKVVMAVDVLDRRRLDGLEVTAADLDLIRRALGPSDDAAMSALWERFDGAGAAGRVSARLGLTATSDPRDSSQWGEMDVSAYDTVRLWRYLLDEMPAADRDLLVADMQAAPAVAKDGFDQAFGLLSPDVDGSGGPGAVAKQGWMCCFSGQYYLHSAGALGSDQRFLVALLTRQPRGPGWEASRQELDRIARAAAQPLS